MGTASNKARRQAPEYLLLFGTEGPVHIRVRFKEPGCSIGPRRCEPSELGRLFNGQTGLPHEYLFFDEHLHVVDRYVWEPKLHQLTIWASAPTALEPAFDEA